MRVGYAVGLVGLLGALALWLMGDAFQAVTLTGEMREAPLTRPGPGWLAATLAGAAGLLGAVATGIQSRRDRSR